MFEIQKLRSEQESVLEYLMSKSFGAASFFVPDKYKKEGEFEAADLAWINGSVAALFYLKSSKMRNRRIHFHNKNIKQAIRYIGDWSSGNKNYVLKGTNRGGDQLNADFSSVRYLIIFSVISTECGVLIDELIEKCGPKELVLLIPEKLVAKVAEFSGTIVDLLNIVDIYVKWHIETQEEDAEKQFKTLLELAEKYADKAFLQAASLAKSPHSNSSEMLQDIHENLHGTTHASLQGQNPSKLQILRAGARYSADMTLFEYVYLTYLIEHLIYEYRVNRNRLLIRAENGGRPFVLGLSIICDNVDEYFEKSIKLATSISSGIRECPIFTIFGDAPNGLLLMSIVPSDARVPMAVGILIDVLSKYPKDRLFRF